MTSNKYIVKNCPCFEKTFEWCQKVDDYGVCENTTDCVMKQVIELCNNDIRPNETNLYKAGRMSLAVNIVGLFDIEEINK